ncbi:MAG: ExbD/TolR family protein [Planctomycetota bacterium]|jgi:biopolymer transport protein ExbD
MKLEAGIARKHARVEIIPLIDCVFILLVFFIYSMLTMTVQRGMVVQLPRATTAEVSQDETIVLTIGADGTLQIDDEVVPADGLRGAVDRARRRAGSARFVLNADRRAEHGWVVRVLDDLKALGIGQVTILSEQGDGP